MDWPRFAHAKAKEGPKGRRGMNRLEGMNAVVTGSGRGLGAAIAVLFAKEGARVLVADVDLSSAEQVVDQIRAMGGEGMPI